MESVQLLEEYSSRVKDQYGEDFIIDFQSVSKESQNEILPWHESPFHDFSDLLMQSHCNEEMVDWSVIASVSFEEVCSLHRNIVSSGLVTALRSVIAVLLTNSSSKVSNLEISILLADLLVETICLGKTDMVQVITDANLPFFDPIFALFDFQSGGSSLIPKEHSTTAHEACIKLLNDACERMKGRAAEIIREAQENMEIVELNSLLERAIELNKLELVQALLSSRKKGDEDLPLAIYVKAIRLESFPIVRFLISFPFLGKSENCDSTLFKMSLIAEAITVQNIELIRLLAEALQLPLAIPYLINSNIGDESFLYNQSILHNLMPYGSVKALDSDIFYKYKFYYESILSTVAQSVPEFPSESQLLFNHISLLLAKCGNYTRFHTFMAKIAPAFLSKSLLISAAENGLVLVADYYAYVVQHCSFISGPGMFYRINGGLGTVLYAVAAASKANQFEFCEKLLKIPSVAQAMLEVSLFAENPVDFCSSALIDCIIRSRTVGIRTVLTGAVHASCMGMVATDESVKTFWFALVDPLLCRFSKRMLIFDAIGTSRPYFVKMLLQHFSKVGSNFKVDEDMVWSCGVCGPSMLAAILINCSSEEAVELMVKSSDHLDSLDVDKRSSYLYSVAKYCSEEEIALDEDQQKKLVIRK